MVKSSPPPADTNAAPTRSRRIAPSVRTAVHPPANRKPRESAARRAHRQRMKTYFTDEKSAG